MMKNTMINIWQLSPISLSLQCFHGIRFKVNKKRLGLSGAPFFCPYIKSPKRIKQYDNNMLEQYCCAPTIS